MISGVLLDLAVLVAVAIALIRGWAHRSIREFFSILGLFIGILIAPALVGPLADVVESAANLDVNVARVISLGFIIGVPALIGAVVGVRTSRAVDFSGPETLDRTGGAMFAIVRAVTIISLILYGTLAVSSSEGDGRSLASAVDDSVSGQILSNPDAPLTVFYDSLLARSADLRALTLWVRQRSGFREEVPSDRLDFAATNERLTPAPEAERRMLQLVNEERLDKGLDALGWCEQCAEVARGHSKDMYRHGYFSHIDSGGNDPFDRMQEAEIVYEAAGENLSIAPTITQSHDGLMTSPDHRENILRGLFDELGVGCWRGPYGFMCTQVFRATT